MFPVVVMKKILASIKNFRLRGTDTATATAATPTAVFFCAAILSSYATVLTLVYHRTNGFMAAPVVNAPSAASQLGSGSASFRNQVEFVSNIIKTNLPLNRSNDVLAKLIVEESLRASIDPLFVAAVIRSESMFRSGVVSIRGAKGLMQIMPETGRYVSERENLRWGGSHTLNDPALNVRLGIAYLKYLDLKFKGDRERVLIAYNWGPGNLSQAIRYRSSPPRQSVNYARGIIKQHHNWRKSFVQVADAAPLSAVRLMVG